MTNAPFAQPPPKSVDGIRIDQALSNGVLLNGVPPSWYLRTHVG